MPFDPREFLALGESLASRETNEAGFRNAVGRAYYAVFLIARDRLRVTGRRNIHQRVIGELRRADRTAADQLARLRELRGLADYQTEVTDPFQDDWARNWRIARSSATFVLERVS